MHCFVTGIVFQPVDKHMITVVPELDNQVKLKYDHSGPGAGY